MKSRTKWQSTLSMLALGAFMMGFAGTVSAKNFIVKDGKPMAEIVVSSEPCRSVAYAAKELQTYIKKISGAELPIYPPFALTDEKGPKLFNQYPPDLKRMPVKIYVGESWHTDRLDVTDDGLEWGAYRIKSGKDWLALVGKDTQFTPMGIWGRNRNHMNKGAEEEWQKAIGDHHWTNPMRKIWINYSDDLDMWAYDQKGTVNAVCGFLRMLGVRWYAPGELGEIVPEMKTIELPEIDETVEPDVKIRDFIWAKYAFNSPAAKDQVIWAMRLGANLPFIYRGAHGQADVTRSMENREKHPDWYALYNGKRDVESRTPNPCLSNESLFNEQVKYIRFVFDMFDPPAVCVAPTDGFTNICQCEKCKGKDTPERGRKGLMSDYVWDYINRIAKEIYKTHPDKLILGCAYSVYWLPPENIGELSPNVAVHIVNARRRYVDPSEEDTKERRDAVKKWAELTDGKIITFQNEGGGRNTPRLFAEDLKAYKGMLMGEEMHGPYQKGVLATPGFTHLPFYVCGRLWWDTDLDLDELLDEYYEKYYGPAAEEMKAFIDYWEVNQQDMRGINAAPVIKKALDLMAKAEAKVDPETVYGKRVALFSGGLAGKRKWYETIKDGRKNPPVYESADVSGEITVDGKLEEGFWKELPGELKEIKGGAAKYPTQFKIGIKDNHLYIGVKCFDEPGKPINISKVERNDDGALWHGDVVEIQLETPVHSYYQIAVNPDGMVCDLDRGRGIFFNWGAEADVAASVNEKEGYWTVEAKIPFTASEQDPLHEIIGTPPSKDKPWYFNICRLRPRDEGNEMTAFAPNPTGKRGFHNIMQFGKLVKE